MTLKEIAQKILDTMDAHEKSFEPNYAGGYYKKHIIDAFIEVFGSSHFKYEPYYYAIEHSWNDMESWANQVLKEEI